MSNVSGLLSLSPSGRCVGVLVPVKLASEDCRRHGALPVFGLDSGEDDSCSSGACGVLDSKTLLDVIVFRRIVVVVVVVEDVLRLTSLVNSTGSSGFVSGCFLVTIGDAVCLVGAAGSAGAVIFLVTIGDEVESNPSCFFTVRI